MSTPRLPQGRAVQAILVMAGVVIVAAGLRAAGEVLLPIVFAGFLSVLAQPVVRALRRMGMPRFAAIAFVVTFSAAFLVGITWILTATARRVGDHIGAYEAQFDTLIANGLTFLSRWGVDTTGLDPSEFQSGVAMQLVGHSFNALITVLSQATIVLITMTFILLEASELGKKIEAAFGTRELPMGPFTKTTDQVQRYLLIKTIASVATAVLVGIGLWVIGVDFPVMWALIAFILNYIPTLGAIISAIPPIALALAELGLGQALIVTGWYVGIHLAIGNFIEPRVMGRTLGLSPLVVFLSLLFWGWLWGPVGALFCVPMTVIGKLILESNEDTRWIAVFLGSPRDTKEELAREAAHITPVPPGEEA